MAAAKTTNQKSQPEIRRPHISASTPLWQAFEKWMSEMGCTSLSEAIRAAMIQVTDFNNKSQEKSVA